VSRPSERTPERITAILSGIEGGLTETDAAQTAGISRGTLYNWKSEDPDLIEAIAAAKSRFVRTLTALILQHAASRFPNSWQAAAWLLERRFPDDFGAKQRLEISIDVRKEAERLASEHGLNVDDVLREAEAVIEEQRAAQKA
jgi:transposase